MEWKGRAILHVDMDAFFTSVEQRDHPHLRGKPVLVGGDGPRSVVAAASYEAREFGCRSAMPMATARRLCPHAIIVGGNHARYSQVSDQIFAILDRITPLVQPVSVDEAYLDVTGSIRMLGNPIDIANQIRHTIRSEVGLTASVGIAPNKLLAKIASDLNKPDGLTVITRETLHDVLDSLPVERMPGVGPSTIRSLTRLGIKTIGELRVTPHQLLASIFGNHASELIQKASGEDDRPIQIDRDAKSIGREETFPTDIPDRDLLEHVLLSHAEQVARRLRRAGLFANALTLKIRYGDFQTITRSRALQQQSDSTQTLFLAARDLYREWSQDAFRPVRLIGLTATNLSREHQLSLFQPEIHEITAADRATDAIVDRYGKDAIRRAATLEAPGRANRPR